MTAASWTLMLLQYAMVVDPDRPGVMLAESVFAKVTLAPSTQTLTNVAWFKM
jgi:hypothetical protein